MTAGPGSQARQDEDERWREAARLRSGHRAWVIIWLAAQNCFKAYRRLPGTRRDTALSAATAGEMAALITQAEQTVGRPARHTPASP